MGVYAGVTNSWINISPSNSLNGLVTSGLVLALDVGRILSYVGSGTTWTDLSGTGAVSAATGGLPIYNTTDTYGAVKGSGTRTDANSSSLVLAIPMDGANNGTTFTDESANIRGSGSAKAITRNGDTKTLTAVRKFYGSSGFFDGTGDYLNLGTSSDYLFGTGDFTIEGWFYLTSDSTRQDLMGNYTDANTGWGIQTSFGVAGQIGFYYGNTIILDSAARVWSPNSWTHFAITRSGTSLKLFVNGVNTTTTTNSTNISTTSYNTLLGAAPTAGSGSPQLFCTGYLQDFRIYKGVAKYTANFTPPGNPNNGTLTNGPTYSSANGGSIVFDGVDDYVETNYTPGNISTQTISCWINKSNLQYSLILAKSTLYYGLEIYPTTIYVNVGINQYGQVSYNTNGWQNIVFTYDGNQTGNSNRLKIYFNGDVQTLTFTGTIPSSANVSDVIQIGRRWWASSFSEGSIAQVSIYNRALSADEVSQNFNVLRSRFGI